jgi:hypothetical protein
MSTQILRLRSSLLYDRVFPNRLGVGEFAVNLHPTEPGVYFADTSASPKLFKIGPIHVGTTAPNAVPSGFTGLCKGESWLDQSSTQILKIYDGTTFQTPKAVASTSTSGYPSNPMDGQLHYDKSVPGLFVYNSTTTSWVAV